MAFVGNWDARANPYPVGFWRISPCHRPLTCTSSHSWFTLALVDMDVHSNPVPRDDAPPNGQIRIAIPLPALGVPVR